MSATKKRKPGVRRSVPARRPRKAAAKKKSAARRKSASRSFEAVIQRITSSVGVARAAIAEASGQGAIVVRRAVGSASRASRKTVTRLANEWKAMDPKRKARILAALLGAAAAASAPLVRRRFQK